MKHEWKSKLSTFYVPIVFFWLFSCILVGASFYAMSITINIPAFEANNPADDLAIAITTSLASFENVFNFIMPFMTTILGLLTIGFLIAVFIIGAVLYYWEKDKRKIALWKEIGFSCERLEFLQGSRIRLNNTEIILNKAQYSTMQKLVHSRILGEALHGIDLGENATQVVKRLREELGSKLIEKTLIMNHRGRGYWVDIDPEKIKGSKIAKGVAS